MWLMIPGGILMPAMRPAHKIPAGDTRTMQVRARKREHLSRFRREYMPELGATVQIPATDYEFRAYCHPAEFALAFTKAIMDIDYCKFKPTTEHWYDDAELHRIYNRIWSVVLDLGDPEHQMPYWHRSPGSTAGQEVTPWVSYSAGGWVGGDDEDWPQTSNEEQEELDGLAADIARLDVDELSQHFDEVSLILKEIDEIRPDLHTTCAHSDTDFARAYCRRLRVNEIERRLTALRKSLQPVVLDK